MFHVIRQDSLHGRSGVTSDASCCVGARPHRRDTAGADPGDEFAQTAMRWMMTMPAGYLVIASGIMHTVFARSTAKNIGWTTNGFQYELGFVSIGLGIAGVVAAYVGGTSWLVLSIVLSVFLLGAAGLHVKEMVRDRNFAWGNTWVLLYDIGLPVSLIALLVAGAA